MIKEVEFAKDKSWIIIDSDQARQTSQAYYDYQIDEEVISYALDKKERALIDYDHSKDSFVLVFNVLNLTQDEHHYETTPITFIIQKNRLITITNQDNNYVTSDMLAFLAKHKSDDMTVLSFLFAGLTLISNRYFPIVEEMEIARDDLNRKLRKRTTKQHLLALSDLETGIVYLVSAANQNAHLLEQVKNHHLYQSFNDTEKEQLDDALIEARQLIAMTQLASQILNQLSGTYNNILNSNLNDNLTILNIISILLAVVAAITGFFGMNVPLPMTDEPYAWIYIILGSLVAWTVIAQGLKWIVRRK